jgi:predicted O-methyltransferase YrrM
MKKPEEKTAYPHDFIAENIEICEAVKPYTMTGITKISALVDAVRYVSKNNIAGAMVECGVWRGGSAMAMMLALKKAGDDEREFYLYDTYEGMSEPSKEDVSFRGDAAIEKYSKTKAPVGAGSNWCNASIEEVMVNVAKTGYSMARISFVKGKVEDTIPATIPQKIAILRLDTDWYESTRHELVHLFPLLQPGGVLLIDDYGYWKGSKKAVDEYISATGTQIYLARIDHSCRIGIKA